MQLNCFKGQIFRDYQVIESCWLLIGIWKCFVSESSPREGWGVANFYFHCSLALSNMLSSVCSNILHRCVIFSRKLILLSIYQYALQCRAHKLFEWFPWEEISSAKNCKLKKQQKFGMLTEILFKWRLKFRGDRYQLPEWKVFGATIWPNGSSTSLAEEKLYWNLTNQKLLHF